VTSEKRIFRCSSPLVNSVYTKEKEAFVTSDCSDMLVGPCQQ
jgi:hypothetical protein